MLSIFSCAYWLSVYLFLEKCLFRFVAHFLNWGVFFFILSCMSYLNILEINPSSFTLLTNIFSHSISCLLVLLMVFFAVQKVLSFIRSHLFFLLFLSPWETYLRKYCYDLCQRNLCLCSLLGGLWCLVIFSL